MPVTTKSACQKCGDEMILFPKNRKFCGACQALRDLSFRPGMHTSCTYCEREFWPSRTTYMTRRACADCSVFIQEDAEKYVACQSCAKHKRTAPGTKQTCISCVQSTKEMQHKYLETLKRRDAQMRAAQGAPA